MIIYFKFPNPPASACLMNRHADAGRFGNLKKKIINDYLRGGPDSLKNLEAAVTLFKHYRPPSRKGKAKTAQQRSQATTTSPSDSPGKKWALAALARTRDHATRAAVSGISCQTAK